MCCKGCYDVGVRVEFNLVVTRGQIKCGKHFCPIEVVHRGSSVPLTLASFGRLMSTHSLIFPGCFGLGATTTGETHGVGPSTRSMMSNASSFSSLRATAVWQLTTGIADLSTTKNVFLTILSRKLSCEQNCPRIGRGMREPCGSKNLD